MERVVYEQTRRVADLQVGQTIETGSRTVYHADITLFCGLTGDMNPLHLSEPEAGASAVHRVVAPATMVQAMSIGLFAQTRWLSAVLVAFVGVSDWRVEKPVYPGDTLRCRITLEQMRPTSDGQSHLLEVLFEVFAQRGGDGNQGESAEDPRVMHFSARFLARDHPVRSMP